MIQHWRGIADTSAGCGAPRHILRVRSLTNWRLLADLREDLVAQSEIDFRHRSERLRENTEISN